MDWSGPTSNTDNAPAGTTPARALDAGRTPGQGTRPGHLRNHAEVDYAAAGLLDGLDGEDRAARERLLDRLVEEGFTQEELQEGVKEDRIALLLVECVLGGRYTARE